MPETPRAIAPSWATYIEWHNKWAHVIERAHVRFVKNDTTEAEDALLDLEAAMRSLTDDR